MCVFVALLMALSAVTAVLQSAPTGEDDSRAAISAGGGGGGGGKLPDLTVLNIWTSPSSPVGGEPVTIYASIYNIGDKDCRDSFNSRMVVDSSTISSTYFDGLDAGASTVHSRTVTLSPGYHDLTVVVDIYGVIEESNEANNERTENTYFSDPNPVNNPPVAEVDSIDPNPAVEGGYVTFMGSATDPDDDPITGYRWWKVGSVSGIPYGTPVLFATTEDVIDYQNPNWYPAEYFISFSAYDGEDWGNSEWVPFEVTSLPDIAVVDIWTDPAEPVGDLTTTIFYQISTNEVSFTETVYTYLYIDGILKDTESLVGSTGTETDLYFHFATLAGGNHELKVITDATNALTESDETNNQRIETITWLAGPPDLVVVDIWTDPIYPLMDQPVTIYYMVKNQGLSAAIPNNLDTFGTGLWIDGQLLGSFGCAYLAPGATVTGSYETSLSIGTHTLRAVADIGRFGQVDESDEFNNERVEAQYWAEDTYDTDGDGLCDGVEWHLGTDPNGFKQYAVIVQGQMDNFPYGYADDQNAALEYSAYVAYEALEASGVDEIWYISNRSYQDIHTPDAPTLHQNVYDAIASPSGFLGTRADEDDRVYLYFVSHGDEYGFKVNMVPFFLTYITHEELETWTSLVTCYRMAVVVESCKSGGFQEHLFRENLFYGNRIVITSTDVENLAYLQLDTEPYYAVFSYAFFQAISWGYAIEGAFDYAWYEVLLNNQEHEYTQAPVMNDFDPAVFWWI